VSFETHRLNILSRAAAGGGNKFLEKAAASKSSWVELLNLWSDLLSAGFTPMGIKAETENVTRAIAELQMRNDRVQHSARKKNSDISSLVPKVSENNPAEFRDVGPQETEKATQALFKLDVDSVAELEHVSEPLEEREMARERRLAKLEAAALASAEKKRRKAEEAAHAASGLVAEVTRAIPHPTLAEAGQLTVPPMCAHIYCTLHSGSR